MGRHFGGYKGGHYGASRSWGQHRAAAGSYRSSKSYSPSNRTAATWGARGAAAAYGRTGTKAAAASGAYRTTLAHGGTKGQAKAAARGAAAGLSGSGKKTYSSKSNGTYWSYSRAVSSYAKAADSLQRQFGSYTNSYPDHLQTSASDDLVDAMAPQISIQNEKVLNKIQECIKNLEELRELIPALHGCQLYRARCAESKLLDLIDKLEETLSEPCSISDEGDPARPSSAEISYHSIEPVETDDCSSQIVAYDGDGPTIDYHELGA